VEALGAEIPLAGRAIGLLPQLGLHNHQRQHCPMATGLDQRLVIEGPQISLEPDNVKGLHGLQLQQQTGLREFFINSPSSTN